MAYVQVVKDHKVVEEFKDRFDWLAEQVADMSKCSVEDAKMGILLLEKNLWVIDNVN